MPDNAERGPKNVRRCVAVELVLMATKAEAINTVALSNIKYNRGKKNLNE